MFNDSFFGTSIRTCRTHDVAAAYRLARAEVRVQLPLGAFVGTDVPAYNGVWESLEIRVVRDHESIGSNPITPTDRGHF